MRKRNLMIAACMMVLSFTMMTGCGKSVADAVQKQDASVQSEQNVQKDGEGDSKRERPQDDGSKTVQVTKVDGDTVTATVGEDKFGGRGPGKGDSADKQAPPEKEDTGSEDSSASQNQGSEADSEKKQPPSDKDGKRPERKMSFTATDETLTFTITSDTKIMTGGRNNSKEATAEEIKENSILRVSVNEKNEAQTIMIMGSQQ